MRPISLFFILLLLAVPTSAAAGRSPSSGPEPSRVVRVGIYENRPIVFRDAQGRASGFFVDILEEVARKRGWRIEYDFDRWSALFAAVRAGRVDLLPAVAYSPERSTSLSLSRETVLTNWGQIYVRRGDPLQSPLDLRGRTIGVQYRDTHGEALLRTLDRFGIPCNVFRYDTYRELFSSLESHVTEAVVVNRIFGSQNADEYHVQATPVVFNPVEVRFAAPLGDPRGLLAALDADVARMKRESDSVYHHAQARWFGGVAPERMPGWLFPGLGGAGMLLMLLAGMNVIMRRRVASRTAELVEARDAAHAASEAKSRFLANMSHEVRTPLNGLLGMLQILRDTPLDAEQEEYVRIALTSGRNLLAVINDVLDLSKIEAGGIDLQEEPFVPAELAGNVSGLFAEEARRKGLDLSLDLGPETREPLVGDQGRLRQILFNLVGNAVKFTREGGVNIRARARTSADGKSEELALEVRDTGIGIDPAGVERCFEPFCQLDASSTRAYGGAGLGLSIVRRLVDLMGGEIRVESAPERGTSFFLRLPMRRAVERERAALAAAAEPAPRHGSARSLRILLGEDNRVNRLALRRFLEKLGHSVLEVASGREVLDVLAVERVDCVLMDVQMPVMDGLEATRRIRAGEVGEANRTLPVVAVTAHAMKGDREQFLAGGMSAYLAKPVELVELRRVLDELFGPAERA